MKNNLCALGCGALLMLSAPCVFADATADANQQISQLQAQMKQMYDTQQKQLQDLNTSLQAQIKQVQATMQEQIQTMNQQSQDQLKQMQTSLEAEIKQLQSQMAPGAAPATPVPVAPAARPANPAVAK